MVGEGVLDSKLTISVGVAGSVTLISDGCIVGRTGVHPANAKTGIKKGANQDNDFIFILPATKFTKASAQLQLCQMAGSGLE
jgi:hypothetical protein